MNEPIRQVRKGYLFDIHPFTGGVIRKILIDDRDMVFIPTYGWINKTALKSYKLIFFPKWINYYNWLEGWYTTNWKFDCWSWCYSMKQSEFSLCRVSIEEDGSEVIWAA